MNQNKGFQKEKQGMFRNKYIWLAFAAAFLPRLIFLFQTYPMSIGPDELFSMGPAAKLVGYDWSGVMQNYRYYGYGYTALLIPFFKLFHDPVVLYRMIVLLMILAQSVIAPIAYHLMKTYLKVENEKILFLSSVCCSYLVAVRAVYTYPEFIYVLLMWLLAWILLKLNQVADNKRKKIVYTLSLVLILFYASTVHSRATAVWIAVAAGIVYYGWVYRKQLVSIPVCLVMGAVAFIVSQKGIEKVVAYIVNASSENVSNTGVYFGAGYLLEDVKSWTAWANIIIGQLNEAVVVTGGLAVFAVVMILLLLWKGLKRKKGETAEVQLISPYLVLGSIFIMAVVITIGGQSISWLGGVTSAMQGTGDPDQFRAFTYFRYYGAYVGPLLMIGISYFYQKKEWFGRLYPVVCVITVLLQGYWVLCILPYVYNFEGCCWDFAPFSLTKGFVDEIRLRTYLPATILVFAILFVSYILYKKHKMQFVLGILCIMLVYSYCYNAVNHEGYRGQKNFSDVDDSVNLLESLDESDALPDVIYVQDTFVEKYLYQFYMLEHPVVSTLPSEEEKETIFLCKDPEEFGELTKQGYLYGKVAENEYIYVRGKNLQEKVGENGITLSVFH